MATQNNVPTDVQPHMQEATERGRAQLAEMKAKETTAKDAATEAQKLADKAKAERALAEDKLRDEARNKREAEAAKRQAEESKIQAEEKHKADLAKAHKKLDAAKAEFEAAKESAGKLADKGASAAKLAEAENKYIKAAHDVQLKQEKVDQLHRREPEAQAKHDARQQAKADTTEPKAVSQLSAEEKAARLQAANDAKTARVAGEGPKPLEALVQKEAAIKNGGAENAETPKPKQAAKTVPSGRAVAGATAAGAITAGVISAANGGSAEEAVGSAAKGGVITAAASAAARVPGPWFVKAAAGVAVGVGVALGLDRIFSSDEKVSPVTPPVAGNPPAQSASAASAPRVAPVPAPVASGASAAGNGQPAPAAPAPSAPGTGAAPTVPAPSAPGASAPDAGAGRGFVNPPLAKSGAGKASPAAGNAGEIVVQSGDSLSKIAQNDDRLKEARKQVEAALGTKDKLTVTLVLSMALAAANDIEKPDMIHPGKKLDIGKTIAKIDEVASKMKLHPTMKDDGKISGAEFGDMQSGIRGKTTKEILEAGR